jgi:hypothetical protein
MLASGSKPIAFLPLAATPSLPAAGGTSFAAVALWFKAVEGVVADVATGIAAEGFAGRSVCTAGALLAASSESLYGVTVITAESGRETPVRSS